jgi:NAD(P)-dependent dehydrogenase (short-subunit alcohol dehydrogenase family)
MSRNTPRISHALITGTSSGLGRGLATRLLQRGAQVYGCSRRPSGLPGLVETNVDLTDHAAVPRHLESLLGESPALQLVVLNAGTLGQIRDISATPLEDLKRVMEVNVWANKTVLDWLGQSGRPVDQIVMISSGASVLGNRGWNGYALSKAALNMLARLYAHEFPDSHLCALAPGIIDTAMMDHLCGEADASRFPALRRLQQARGTSAMPVPGEAAEQILSVLDDLRGYPSGSFVDIRQIREPEEYERLFGRNA